MDGRRTRPHTDSVRFKEKRPVDRYAVARHEVQLAAILVLQVRNSFSFVHSFWAAGLLSWRNGATLLG